MVLVGLVLFSFFLVVIKTLKNNETYYLIPGIDINILSGTRLLIFFLLIILLMLCSIPPTISIDKTLNVDERQLRWLLDGLSLEQIGAHKPVDERIII